MDPEGFPTANDKKARPVLRQAGLLFKVQLLIVFGTTAVPQAASGWFGQRPCSIERNSPLPHLQR